MKILSFLARYSPASILLAVAASCVSGASNAGLLAVLNAALRGESLKDSRLVWTFVALCIFLPLSRFSTELLLTRIGQGALFDLRVKISRQILATPLRRLEEFGVRRLMTTLSDDIPTITATLSAIAVLCINIAIVIGGLIYLAWLSPAVLLLVLLFLGFGIVCYQLPVIKSLHYFRLARKEGDALFGHFRALTTGTKELKLHHRRRETFINEVLKGTAAAQKRHNIMGATIYSAAASWGQILIYVIVALILFGLPVRQNLNAQVLTGYTLTLLYLMTPLQVIMNTIPTLSRASIALERITELGLKLAAQGTEVYADAPAPPAITIESVELINVVHAYRREGEDSDFRLGPIDMSLRGGELLFLVGGNGSGKTTLAKLLCGLYIPEEGEVRLDGQVINDRSRDFYREHFSMVFSDYYLFESLLGLDAPELDKRALDYLTKFQLNRKVAVKGGVLSTTDLSQGQRKRLALLTAYLEDRPIYVFDEWAADQDPQFKEIFYRQLLPELKARGKTLVVISHDDRYYDVADRLIKLEYGQIVDDLQKPLATPVITDAPVTS
jgi:putative ATP-binding cassette transporter